MKVAVLSGGVGGARFVQGLVDVIEPRDVTVVGNVGDDVEVLGLHVSPDLDSILYALAGLNDEERGWGRADETWRALETVRSLGGEDLVPARRPRPRPAPRAHPGPARRRAALGGHAAAREALGIEPRLLPATDDRLRTWIKTPAGEFPFQEWFVARGHRDEVDAVRFEGEAEAPAPGVLEALDEAELLLVAPSNPYVSIGPILAVPEIREALAARRVPAVAVSPLIGGHAVRGPADRMLRRLAGGTSPAHVAGTYPGLIDALVVDEADADDLDGLGDVRPIVTRTLMSDPDARRRLAEAALGAVVA